MAASPAVKKPSLFIVDGSNNVYRSYFAIRGLTNSAGLATNAVYGFTTMLRKMLKDHEPDLVAVAFDVSGAKTRHEAFADYKKDRRPMPDDLAVQLPFVDATYAPLKRYARSIFQRGSRSFGFALAARWYAAIAASICAAFAWPPTCPSARAA